MPVLLLSHHLAQQRGADLIQRAKALGTELEIVALPEDREGRPPDSDIARIDSAFFSSDIYPDRSRQFFTAARKAQALKWLHAFNVGVDHPIYSEMLARGVRITTSSGSTAIPIAQTAIAALLMLARNFPHWIDAQRRHAWEPARAPNLPRDLSGQTAVVIGLGHIGKEIARLARALGVKVIGVRRSPRKDDDPVDELYPPDQLATLLPRADWLVLACPLSEETRRLIDARMLGLLPSGARLINIARGEVVDEAALTNALRSGRLAGAYLDVFEQEPLPADSPLWDMPNVIATPHNSAAASGNDERVYQIFVDNCARWIRGEPLVNEVHRGDAARPGG
jgi:D-2-hydroxyacid dehydrogenase (NADP+)